MEFFQDNGQGSYTFDRPDYIALENFIKRHKGQCQYLVVLDHDRFSRNLHEALIKIAELERRYNVIVISTNERVDLDTSDPDVFMKRAFDYMMANKELFTIRSRTRQGIRNAKENGRYLGRAPFGYKNIKNGLKNNLIEVDPVQSKIVKQIFQQYLLGIEPHQILKSIKLLGFTKTGYSVIQDILKNCTYAGLIKVPAYKLIPEKYVIALHGPIITIDDYWSVQKKLNLKRPQKVRANEDFPLRGFVKCKCGKKLTAAWSKGRTDYYLYYKCTGHPNANVSGKKIHERFEKLLKIITFLPHQIDFIEKTSSKLMESNKKFEVFFAAKLNLYKVYSQCTVTQKHLLLYGIFRNGLTWMDGKFISDFFNPSLQHELKKAHERGLFSKL